MEQVYRSTPGQRENSSWSATVVVESTSIVKTEVFDNEILIAEKDTGVLRMGDGVTEYGSLPPFIKMPVTWSPTHAIYNPKSSDAVGFGEYRLCRITMDGGDAFQLRFLGGGNPNSDSTDPFVLATQMGEMDAYFRCNHVSTEENPTNPKLAVKMLATRGQNNGNVFESADANQFPVKGIRTIYIETTAEGKYVFDIIIDLKNMFEGEVTFHKLAISNATAFEVEAINDGVAEYDWATEGVSEGNAIEALTIYRPEYINSDLVNTITHADTVNPLTLIAKAPAGMYVVNPYTGSEVLANGGIVQKLASVANGGKDIFVVTPMATGKVVGSYLVDIDGNIIESKVSFQDLARTYGLHKSFGASKLTEGLLDDVSNADVTIIDEAEATDGKVAKIKSGAIEIFNTSNGMSFEMDRVYDFKFRLNKVKFAEDIHLVVEAGDGTDWVEVQRYPIVVDSANSFDTCILEGIVPTPKEVAGMQTRILIDVKESETDKEVNFYLLDTVSCSHNRTLLSPLPIGSMIRWWHEQGALADGFIHAGGQTIIRDEFPEYFSFLEVAEPASVNSETQEYIVPTVAGSIIKVKSLPAEKRMLSQRREYVTEDKKQLGHTDTFLLPALVPAQYIKDEGQVITFAQYPDFIKHLRTKGVIGFGDTEYTMPNSGLYVKVWNVIPGEEYPLGAVINTSGKHPEDMEFYAGTFWDQVAEFGYTSDGQIKTSAGVYKWRRVSLQDQPTATVSGILAGSFTVSTDDGNIVVVRKTADGTAVYPEGYTGLPDQELDGVTGGGVNITGLEATTEYEVEVYTPASYTKRQSPSLKEVVTTV